MENTAEPTYFLEEVILKENIENLASNVETWSKYDLVKLYIDFVKDLYEIDQLNQKDYPDELIDTFNDDECFEMSQVIFARHQNAIMRHANNLAKVFRTKKQ